VVAGIGTRDFSGLGLTLCRLVPSLRVSPWKSLRGLNGGSPCKVVFRAASLVEGSLSSQAYCPGLYHSLALSWTSPGAKGEATLCRRPRLSGLVMLTQTPDSDGRDTTPPGDSLCGETSGTGGRCPRVYAKGWNGWPLRGLSCGSWRLLPRTETTLG